jgi:nucleoside-diphosphate-sugar epimerase
VKIVVTGGSGFVGRYLLTELGKYPVQLTTITRDASRWSHPDKNIQVLEFDIASAAPDCYQTLGSPDALHYRFLKMMVEGGLPSLLVAGSCLECGLQPGPVSEEMDTLPNSPYGLAKDSLRKQLQFLQAVVPYNLTWARFFYIYGDDQPANTLFSKQKAATLRGDRVFPLSSVDKLRDYLSVQEVARLMAVLARHGFDAGVVNICSGTPLSIRSLAETWIQQKGWDIQLAVSDRPYPECAPYAYWGVRDKLDNLLAQVASGRSGLAQNSY